MLQLNPSPIIRSFELKSVNVAQVTLSNLLSPFIFLSLNLSQKPTTGYKGLMKGYQHQVKHLAGDDQKDEVMLVVNLFQSVLDGFIRGEIKKEEAEPAKVKYI